jgi:hypothetical protein
MKRNSCRLDGDSSRSFGRKEICDRGSIVYVSYPASETAVIEHALCCRRFPGINMGDDTDISSLFKICTF